MVGQLGRLRPTECLVGDDDIQHTTKTVRRSKRKARRVEHRTSLAGDRVVDVDEPDIEAANYVNRQTMMTIARGMVEASQTS